MKFVTVRKSVITLDPRIIAIFVLSLFTFSTSFAVRQWTVNDDIIDGVPIEGAVHIAIQNLGIGHLRLQFTQPDVKMEQVELNNHVWTLVTIDGETRLWQNGKPALPLISRAVRLPNTGNVKLIVTPGEYTEYQNVDVLPQQPTDLIKSGDGYQPVSYAYDGTIYKTNSFYPSDIAVLTSPEIIRDARIALLGVHPVQYNPVTRTLRVYQSIQVELQPIGGLGANELYDTRSHAVPSFAGIYSDIIGADDLFDDARRAPPGQTLFITRAGVDTTLQHFIDWKTQSGHPSRLYVTTATSTAPIQTYIDSAYSTWNPPLEMVVLVGGGGTTNSQYQMPSYPAVSYQYTDHDYGRMTSSLNASVWVGRILCDNITELQTQINKSMNYERTPYMGPTGSDTAWFNTGWGYASISSSYYIISNPPCIQFCLSMMRQRGIMNTLYDTHDGHVSSATINSRITPGLIFWAHRASWEFEIAQSDVQGINNINKPFVGFNISCATGNWYPSDSYGMPTVLTKMGTPSQPKGALTSVSTQGIGTNPAHNNVMAAGSLYGFGVNNARQPGPMYFEGKFQLWRNYRIGDSSNAANFVHWNNPMGDISVNVWTGVPRTVTASIPQSIGIGQNRLELQVMHGTVPVAGAMVTAWKKNSGGTNETYTRAVTDDSGRVVLTLTNTTVGNMLVTVSGNQVGQNIYPLIDTVAVAQTSVDLAVGTTSIQDDNNNGRSGNNNGAANPGETIDLNVPLLNRGTQTASVVTGTLISYDSRITVTNSTAEWDNVSAGQSMNPISPFRIQLSGGFTDNEMIPLLLNLVTDGGNRSISVPVTVRTMNLLFVTSGLSTAWNPGGSSQLSITVLNNGGLGFTTPTSVTLTSLTSGASVVTPTIQFPTLPIGSQVNNNSARWTIWATTSTVLGMQISFSAVFTNGSSTDTVNFVVPVGTKLSTDPSGPDSYGYYAYDNTDVTYTNAPIYQWVELIPALGGTGTRLTLNDNVLQANSASSDVSTLVRLPFTVHYYGISYDSVTICSNGWLAFGAQPQYNNSRNWHLPAFEGPRNMVAVNWCDQTNSGTNEGVYTYSDVANHRYIVTWKTTTLYTPSPQEVQLIIYDPSYYPTPTGDASLKFQYKTFNPAAYSGGESGVSFATVGIADNTYTRALEYCNWNLYTAGSASIPTGTPTSGQRAILFTTVATDSLLHLIQPRGGDSLAVGGNYNIQWRGRNGLPVVNLEINRSYPGGIWETILDSVANTGSANWLVTSPLSTTARIRVVSPNGTEGDSSRTNIIIATPRLTLTAPNGGETWSGLNNNNITWINSVLTGTVTIELNRHYGDSTGTWDTLFSAVANNGTHQWRPDVPSSTQCRIRILSDLIPTVGDTSNADFSIVAPGHFSFAPNPLTQTVAPGDTFRQTVTISNTGEQPITDGILTTTTATGTFGWISSTQPGGPTYSWVDPTSGQQGPQSDDIVSGPYSLPFTFPFYGQNYTQVYMCSNGFITFNSGASNTTTGTIPTTGFQTFIAPYWHDLYPTQSGQAKVFMDTENQSAVFAWVNCPLFNPRTSTVNVEVILYADGRIYFEYGTCSAGSAAVGLQQNSTTYSVVGNTYAVTSNTAILYQRSNIFCVPSQTSFSIPAGGNIQFSILWDARNRSLGDSLNGIFNFSGSASNSPLIVPVIMNVGIVDAASDMTELPKRFALNQNYPNPFNPVTEIKFQLDKSAMTKLDVFDVSGRKVLNLVNGVMSPGTHSASFNGTYLSSGVYFYRLQSGTNNAVRKMMLVK